MSTVVIEELEAEIAARAYEPAALKLLRALQLIDTHHGHVGALTLAHTPPGLSPEEIELLVAARLAQAIGTLFADPGFTLSDGGFFDFITRQRWIGTLFAATPLRNADHVIRALGGVRAPEGTHLDLQHPALLKLCVLYVLDSDLSLDVDELWYRSPRLCASLLMALLSPRMNITANGHNKRELILGWLPQRLDQLQTIAAVPEGFIHDVWMHCSYAIRDDKHAVKAPLNRLIRRRMLAEGITDVVTAYEPPAELPEKQTLMVVLEWFHGTHSIYRTHSLSMLALKERYRLVGVGLQDCTDDTTRAMFDEFVLMSRADPVIENVRKTLEVAARVRPQLVYYPSLGMFPYTIYTANLRLAPMQLAALGHPATTLAPTMDYVVVEEDYIGDPACFTERLIAVPKQAIPYRPPAHWPERCQSHLPDTGAVRVAVIGATMKMNVPFLQTCRQIQQQARARVEFHFIPAFANGLTWLVARAEITRQVPGAVVHRHMPFAEYLQCISGCDLFLNPFPFGNTNSIVDAVSQGLPGVCRSHREVHSNIDRGLFGRLGLPMDLAPDSEQGMIEATVRLIDDPGWRKSLSEQLERQGLARPLFGEQHADFCRYVVDTHARHPMRLVNEPVVSSLP